MADAQEYRKIAEMVDAIDAAYSGGAETIDVNSVFSNRIETKILGYAQISALLERGGAAPEVPEYQPQAPAPQTQVQQTQTPKHDLGKEKSNAAVKLKSMVGNIEKEFEGAVSKKVEEFEERNLVMPTLSLQDQLTDIEKISDGVRENAFNPEQKKIIIQEIKWLSSSAARIDPEKLDQDSRNILVLRDQKVKELRSKLNVT